MTSETKEEKVKLTYDDRRKILKQKKSQTTENIKDEVKVKGKVTEEAKLISTVRHSMEVDYTEEGIKLAYKNLVESKKVMIERVADLEKKFEGKEMAEDLKLLKKQIQEIAKHDISEKSKIECESIKENLKKTSKELEELKEAIGDRLKL